MWQYLLRVELRMDMTMMALELTSMAVFTADEAILSEVLMWQYLLRVELRMAWYSELKLVADSASTHVRAMMDTAAVGCSPLAVSPESMTASVPSRTALATSEHSARVGRGLTIIDSSICVAVMTGLPEMLASRIIIFWARKTFSGGISMPRSPRATMMPSVTFRMSS